MLEVRKAKLVRIGIITKKHLARAVELSAIPIVVETGKCLIVRILHLHLQHEVLLQISMVKDWSIIVTTIRYFRHSQAEHCLELANCRYSTKLSQEEFEP